MLRPLFALALLLALFGAAFAKESEKDARARTQAQAVLEQYLGARFRGADWKDLGASVMWPQGQEPACTTVVRSYNVDSVRLADKDRALATVTFYQLGTYCPAEQMFQPAPRLDAGIFQLRHRSVVWLVEKTNRPGGQLDWQVVRDRLKQALADPTLSAADTAKSSAALAALERTANAIGKTGTPTAPK